LVSIEGIFLKVALGNLGYVTYALKTSLETLGVEVLISPPNNELMHRLSQKYMPSELCYPLKLLLGNYIYNKEHAADAVIFFSGCDMCNLSPVTYSYKEIFNELGWYPEVYFCEINSKKQFILTYTNVLKKISKQPWHKLAASIYLGVKKYELFNNLDQVFYSVRPAFSDKKESEEVYNELFNDLIEARNSQDLKNIKERLFSLHQEYSEKLPTNSLRLGLIGDVYSLSEPFTHHYTDKHLGHMGVIVDRWSEHKFLPDSLTKYDKTKTKTSLLIEKLFKNQYGVFTSLELTKIIRYVDRGYDGLVFIAPLECNPNDALRNLLSTVQNETGVPILELVFDEHTSSMGVKARLEAFVDMLHRRKSAGEKCIIN
jgi:predicted nucleotide-binding protein (sugar kinase/HSP70/actin superfamily)